MVYIVTSNTIDSVLSNEISRVEYEQIKIAWLNLAEVYHLEESIDAVIENYIEFEMDLLEILTRHVVGEYFTPIRFNKDMRQINRRISNLLSACRGYFDHSPKHLKKIYGNLEDFPWFKESSRKLHSENFGYRVMEALRNYTQHRGVPISQIVYHGWARDPEVEWVHSLECRLDIQGLVNDKSVNKNITRELKKLGGEPLNMNSLVRDYVDCIRRLHIEVRCHLRPLIEEWEHIIEQVSEYAPRVDRGSFTLLNFSLEEWEGEKTVSATDISDIMIFFRKELEKKNPLTSKINDYDISRTVK